MKPLAIQTESQKPLNERDRVRTIATQRFKKHQSSRLCPRPPICLWQICSSPGSIVFQRHGTRHAQAGCGCLRLWNKCGDLEGIPRSEDLGVQFDPITPLLSWTCVLLTFDNDFRIKIPNGDRIEKSSLLGKRSVGKKATTAWQTAVENRRKRKSGNGMDFSNPP
jgi:hypothetical protein